MSRKRKTNTLKFWQSAHLDNTEKRFDQVGNSLLLSPQFKNLSAGAQGLYQRMSMESAGKAQFYFPQSAAKKYGIAASSFWRYVQELERAHFIDVYSGKNLRKPNIYKFSMDWKLPPSSS